MNIEQMTDAEIDVLQEQYDCFGECDAPRIHDFARAILAARDAQWNALIAGQAGEAVAWTDEAIEALAFKHEAFGFGRVDAKGLTTHGFDPEGLRDFARELLASLPAPQTVQAESMRERLQKQCSAWGAYWRASDAHGVELTKPQAIELLQDALGVEVEIKDNGCQACAGTGMIGGPSYYSPDEGGVPCPDCAAPSPVGKAEQAEAPSDADPLTPEQEEWVMDLAEKHNLGRRVPQIGAMRGVAPDVFYTDASYRTHELFCFAAALLSTKELT